MTAELRGEFHQDFISRLIYNSFNAPEFRYLSTPEQGYAIIACIRFYGSIELYSYAPSAIVNAIVRHINGKCGNQSAAPKSRNSIS